MAVDFCVVATGSQFKVTANMNARKVAVRNSGIALVVLVTDMKTTSRRRLRPSRVKAPTSMPSGTLTVITINRPVPASWKVRGKRCCKTLRHWLLRDKRSAEIEAGHALDIADELDVYKVDPAPGLCARTRSVRRWRQCRLCARQDRPGTRYMSRKGQHQQHCQNERTSSPGA